jgi:UDPglucose 6-dehydrogenase
MDLVIVGAGRVGTTTAGRLADLGHDVVIVGATEQAVEAVDRGRGPVRTPGLDDLVAEHAGDRLRATTDYGPVRGADATVLAVPTPVDEGGVDTSAVEAAADGVGSALADADGRRLVAVKSPVPPGTSEVLVTLLLRAAAGEDGAAIDVAVAPEFARPGPAVEGGRHPEKLVFGTATEFAAERLRSVYEPVLDEVSVVDTGLREAETIKYAADALAAATGRLFDELGNVCKEYDIDAAEVVEAVDAVAPRPNQFDSRRDAGRERAVDEAVGDSGVTVAHDRAVGWGHPRSRDRLAALVAAARERGYDPELLDAAAAVDDHQPERLLSLLDRHVDVAGRRVAVLGFPAPVRASRALGVVDALLDRDAEVVAYDPDRADAIRDVAPAVDVADGSAAALEGAVGTLVVAPREEFAALDGAFDRMADPVVVDACRIVDRRDGVTYEGLSW